MNTDNKLLALQSALNRYAPDYGSQIKKSRSETSPLTTTANLTNQTVQMNLSRHLPTANPKQNNQSQFLQLLNQGNTQRQTTANLLVKTENQPQQTQRQTTANLPLKPENQPSNKGNRVNAEQQIPLLLLHSQLVAYLPSNKINGRPKQEIWPRTQPRASKTHRASLRAKAEPMCLFNRGKTPRLLQRGV